MKRLWKTAVFFLGLLLVLFSAAALALRVLLPPEKARQLVVEAAGKALKREVRLKGLSIGLLRGVVAEGLEISEAPDFRAGVLARADSFRLRLSLLPLLRKKIVVESVAAEGLALALTRGKDGALRLPRASAAPAAPQPAGAASFELAVKKASLKRGSVIYRDEASGARWTLSELSAEVSHFGLDRAFPLEASFKAEGRAGSRPVKAEVSFSGQLDPAGGDLEKMSVVIQKLSLADAGVSLHVSGKAAAAPKPSAELRLALAAVKKEILTADVQVEGEPPFKLVRARFSAKTPGLEERFLKLLGAPEGAFLPAGSASGRLEWAGESAKLAELVVKTEAGMVEAEAEVKGLGKANPDIRARAKLALSLPAFKGSDLPWAKIPAGRGFPAARLAGLVRLERQNAVLEAFSLETEQGRVVLDGTLRDIFSSRPEPDVSVSLKLDLPAFVSADVPLSAFPQGLALPASHWEGVVSLAADQARFKPLRIKMGGMDLEMEGGLNGLSAGQLSVDLLLKCRSFVLEELTRIAPATREMGLSGRGFFALAVKGPVERPLLAGKLQFQGLGAQVGGLKLADFTGQARFDERRIDVPNLKGLFAGSPLTMDLTVKDYAKAPDVDLVAELAQFDLGAFLAAKAAMAKDKKASSAAAPASQEAAKSPALRAKGKLTVAKLVHPNASARQAKLSWELSGITPDLKLLGGWAKLAVGPGSFNDLGLMAAQSPVMKVLVLPVLLLQKIGGIGGIRLFPDLNNIAFSEIGGDYIFKQGVMQVRESHLYSEALHATTAGSIDLPSEKLDLVVTAQVGRVAPIDIGVTGTFSKPVAKPRVAKFLADPAKELLRNIIKLP